MSDSVGAKGGHPRWGLHVIDEILAQVDSFLGHSQCISWVELTEGEKK